MTENKKDCNVFLMKMSLHSINIFHCFTKLLNQFTRGVFLKIIRIVLNRVIGPNRRVLYNAEIKKPLLLFTLFTYFYAMNYRTSCQTRSQL